jgi:hypothetical protein
MRNRRFPTRVFRVVPLVGFTLVLAGASDSCDETRVVAPPSEILVAQNSVYVELTEKVMSGKFKRPKAMAALSGDALRKVGIFKWSKGELVPIRFSVSGNNFVGDFARGDRVLLQWPDNGWARNKYQLFCGLRVVHTRFPISDVDFRQRLCPLILCPAEPFFADRLLDDFPDLEGFRSVFDRSQMSRMEIGPIGGGGLGGGFGNLCDQCFQRDLGTLVVPDCHESEPVEACWVPQGPGPNTLGQVENITDREVVGAVNAVTPHPTDSNIVYVGGVNGGIWRTGNATAANPSWQRETDFKKSLSIGALEFDPTDATNKTLWAGFGLTSSLLRRGGARAGLLVTTNGTSWSARDGGGTVDGLNISGIAPRGATVVIAANDADTFADRGIWRSTDSGASFTQLSGATGTGLPTGAVFDLVGDPSNNNRLYAHAGGGIFRSDDTGANWARVSNATVDAALVGASNVELAVGTSNNVYVAVVKVGRLSALFRSGNAGGTWTALDLPQTTENAGATFGIHPGGQGGLHLSIAADRTNANVVYLGGDRQPCFLEAAGCQTNPLLPPLFPNSLGANDYSGRLFRVNASQPAGSQAAALTHVNTTSNSAPHADSRDMDVLPNGDLIEVDDGGIYRRTTPRANAGDWLSMNGDLQTTEFHDVAWDGNANVVIGGAQDTGTPEQGATGSARWRSVTRADGGDVAVDDTGSPGLSVRYASAQSLGNFQRRTYNAANTLQSVVYLANPAFAVTAGSNPVIPQFYTPIAANNANPNRLIIGAANSVYESTDQGTTWTEIGVGIQVNGLGDDPIAYGASDNANILYVGVNNQVLIRTTVAGALTPSATYPGVRAIVDIAIDPSDSNTAFVADSDDVFMTSDRGTNWTDVTGNLNTLEVGTLHAIVFGPARPGIGGRPDGVAVGTDVGVFLAQSSTFDVWQRLGCSLPTVPVYDLDYDAGRGKFVAGTLGRGAWTLEDD